TGSSVLDGNGGDRIDPPDGEPGDPKPKKSIFDSGIVSYLSTVFYNLVFNETEIDGKNYVSTTTAQEKLPYYLALSLSGTFILGGGAGLDLTLGYVKNDGLFGNASLRVGFGVDMSLDAAMTVGSYSGFDKPTATSTAWANTYENIGFGLLSITFQQDVSSIGQTGALGLNWNYTSLGLTFGSKSIVGGSTGISLTTYPWYFYKFND
ncbi:MAG: hypothetical protein JXR51_15340, partial [Bacteroidales bacterium]|nr:hypothetical protein [Bacteroidales bacterium]